MTMNAPEPSLARRPLAVDLADRLRDLIVDGGLSPDERISEKDLCEQFGVSRTPLREALKMLAREGLVVLTQNRGATVAPLTLAYLEEAFPILATLEGLTGQFAAANATDPEIAGIAQINRRMTAAYEAGDRQTYLQLNDAFHTALSAAARNQTLAETKQGIEQRLRRARRRASLDATRWADAVAEHRDIVAALEARDGDRLSAALQRHMEHKLSVLRRMLYG
jgi:DNA-binding GntR family transcriptional regulator